MNIPCCNPPSICLSDAPITNYSSEAPDARDFISRYYGPPNEPPLNRWTANGCRGIVCVSTISQADADACAQRSYINCLREPPNCWNCDVDPNPDPDGPPTVTPGATFQNTDQSCDFECSDGSIFTYTVPAGTYSAFNNQASADAIAKSFACQRVVDTRICIGDLLPASTCEGEFFSATVPISIISADFPIVVSLVAGALPVDMTLDYDPDVAEFTISGTAGVAGTYGFTIQVEDFSGNFNQRTYTLNVIEIANPPTLPDADFGQPYSQTLTVGGTPTGTVTWAVTAGSLPTGVTLNPTTGVISGTPSVAGTFNFTVTMTDES